jgi:hypothetical protein
MNTEATSTLSYTPRKRSAEKVNKPVIFPGNLIITGTPNMAQEIDRLAPNDGNRRREALLLMEAWHRFGYSTGNRKSDLILMAARALQATDKAFGDQVRQNGEVVTGLSRAKCTMAKTCHWMLTEKLFIPREVQVVVFEA